MRETATPRVGGPARRPEPLTREVLCLRSDNRDAARLRKWTFRFRAFLRRIAGQPDPNRHRDRSCLSHRAWRSAWPVQKPDRRR